MTPCMQLLVYCRMWYVCEARGFDGSSNDVDWHLFSRGLLHHPSNVYLPSLRLQLDWSVTQYQLPGAHDRNIARALGSPFMRSSPKPKDKGRLSGCSPFFCVFFVSMFNFYSS